MAYARGYAGRLPKVGFLGREGASLLFFILALVVYRWPRMPFETEYCGQGAGGGVYLFVACLSHVAIDHASL